MATTNNCYLTTNQSAFATVATLAVVTISTTVAAATTAATVALVAYSILAISAAGLSIAAITAWVKTNAENGDSSAYFSNLQSHAGFALAGTYTLISQVLVQSLVAGIGQGIKNAVSRFIGGADHTVEVRNR